MTVGFIIFILVSKNKEAKELLRVSELQTAAENLHKVNELSKRVSESRIVSLNSLVDQINGYLIGNKSLSRKKIDEIICQIFGGESYVLIENEINTLGHGVVDGLKTLIPVLSNDDIKLLLLLKWGLSPIIITTIFNISYDNMRKRRSRIIEKISKADSQYSDKIVNFFW